MNRQIAALVLLLVFHVVSFGLRTLLHYRRTGSSGFLGISLSSGPAGSIGGISFLLALVTGLAAPLAELFGLVDPLVEPSTEVAMAGIALGIAGVVGTAWAQSSMGVSWRIGVSEKERTPLVAAGPFRWVRNPIFGFMLLTAIGLALLLPNVLSILAFGLLLLGVELQVRFIEEPYLMRTHGEAYASYCRRIGRFVPGFGRNPH